ncbi:MAG: hypothetical protein HY052_01620 [Proteobacteria bacterium]|nr:hypothetical protein [Pseudomonadota bacterium]
MDKKLLEKYLKQIGSDSDVDAVMGLRGLYSLFQSTGVSMENALWYAVDHLNQCVRNTDKELEQQSPQQSPAASVASMSSLPECRMSRPGMVEIVPSGKTHGDLYPLPGSAARYADTIAAGLKDALVVAVVNKSRFKLKLIDAKGSRDEGAEAILQAEYERPGMTPVRVWAGSRGEVGALAAVLRKAMNNSVPELVAA